MAAQRTQPRWQPDTGPDSSEKNRPRLETIRQLADQVPESGCWAPQHDLAWARGRASRHRESTATTPGDVAAGVAIVRAERGIHQRRMPEPQTPLVQDRFPPSRHRSWPGPQLHQGQVRVDDLGAARDRSADNQGPTHAGLESARRVNNHHEQSDVALDAA